VMGRTALPRLERGAGRPGLDKLPYPVEGGLAALKPFATIILIGAPDPVAFFGYPNKPSRLADPSTRILALAHCADDIRGTLERLADAFGAKASQAPLASFDPPPMPQDGKLTPETAMAVLANLMPDNAIVADESVSSGRMTHVLTAAARPHDWLQITGGSIGIGPPLALGASIACPDRKVINLQADGSAMYTLQALWTQAREKADVVTVIWSNRSYGILVGELMNVGAGNPGRAALDMISLDNPAIDWTLLARGMGVEAVRADSTASFRRALEGALGRRGPFLIEAVI
jgi:acetolactate synthase I/II/III large subunit